MVQSVILDVRLSDVTQYYFLNSISARELSKSKEHREYPDISLLLADKTGSMVLARIEQSKSEREKNRKER
jgi:hypothetical protein